MTRAAAPYITFLDSDDALMPAAVRTLLEAAAADEADVVCGRARRLQVADGTWKEWRSKLYRDRQRLSSINEFVDLATDTISTAKLYRLAFLRDNGIAMPENLHYEDLVFTAQVYKHAKIISVVPDHVYVWKSYPVEDRKTITRQRGEEQNLLHRLEAVRRVEEAVSGSDDDVLRERLQLKFLRHDARLYLNDITDCPRETAERILAMLEPSLRRTPLATYERLSVLERLLYSAALSGSVDAVLELMPALHKSVTLTGRTILVGDTVLWRPTAGAAIEPEPSSLEYTLSDVTDSKVINTAFSAIKYGHVATGTAREPGGGVEVSGTTPDPFNNVLTRISDARGSAVFRLRGTQASFSCPVTFCALDNGLLGWEFTFKVPPKLPFERPMRFDISLEIDAAGQKNASPIVFGFERKPRVRAVSTGRIRSRLRQRFVLYCTKRGRLALKLAETNGRRDQVERVLLSLAALMPSRNAGRVANADSS